jgi:hypothetical protein
MNAGAILCQLSRRQRRPIRAREPSHDFGIGVARTARFRHTLRVHFRLRIFGRANAVNAVATHARRRAIVVFLEQRPAMRAVLELRQLIGRQRGIELMHHGRIRMAARTELNDPRAILIAIFLRPFLHVIMTEIGGGIAAVTPGTRESAPKMNILDNFFQIHVRRRRARAGRDRKKILG